MTLSVLLAGGGTTGHVAPLLALADCLRGRDDATRVTALGTSEGLEARLVPEAGYPLEVVPRVPMPRRPSADLTRLPSRLNSAIRAATAAIESTQAQVVVGFGGYVSTPAYLAARRLGVPIVVHEANARPGLANRLGARLTRHVAATFEGTGLSGVRVIGMPMRRSITHLDRRGLRSEGRAAFGLHPTAVTLLVTGGSLGAQRLNTTFGQAATDLLPAGVQVLHAAGRGKRVDLQLSGDAVAASASRGIRYVEVEYLDRMDLAYAAADVVACRSGAGTVSEITALGLPAVYVPLPIGNGEQRLNAEPVVRAGGGLLVADEECTPDWVRNSFLPVLSDDARLASMGTAAASFGIRDADERLADMVEEAASGRGATAGHGRRAHLRD